MIFKTLENEIHDYLNNSVDLSEDIKFSAPKLIKRISVFLNQTYTGGNIDSQNNYLYWFDIITSRINSEVKNIDFDSKDVSVYSEAAIADRLAVLLSNLYLQQWTVKNRIGGRINDDIEEFSGWGNIVWKKVKDGYETADLRNFYVLNQTAKTLEDSDVIERHILTQSDLRAKKGIWKNVDEVIKTCGNRYFSATEKSTNIDTTNKFYEIYERNGEISQKDFNEAKGKKGGDEDKYIMAKIIVAGLKKSENGGKYILFVEEMKEKPYKEAHRGRYEGRWFRRGMVEILFDCQNRANEIGNQLARGLEWASKTIFRHSDIQVVQNALTGLRNGDMIKTKDLAQVEVRMQGFDQLMADWNRNIQMANEIANSYEVVQGITPTSGTPLGTSQMLNTNAGKLFDLLREKLALGLEEVFNDWIIPEMLKDLKTEKILELTGNEKILEQYNEMLVNAWYLNNLLSFPPHSTQDAEQIKELKLEELKGKKQTVELERAFWDNFKPRAKVVISGEGVKKASEIETTLGFIGLEIDPVRRSYLLDLALAKAGIDTSGLPRSTPEQLSGTQPQMMPQPAQPI